MDEDVWMMMYDVGLLYVGWCMDECVWTDVCVIMHVFRYVWVGDNGCMYEDVFMYAWMY